MLCFCYVLFVYGNKYVTYICHNKSANATKKIYMNLAICDIRIMIYAMNLHFIPNCCVD